MKRTVKDLFGNSVSLFRKREGASLFFFFFFFSFSCLLLQLKAQGPSFLASTYFKWRWEAFRTRLEGVGVGRDSLLAAEAMREKGGGGSVLFLLSLSLEQILEGAQSIRRRLERERERRCGLVVQKHTFPLSLSLSLSLFLPIFSYTCWMVLARLVT